MIRQYRDDKNDTDDDLGHVLGFLLCTNLRLVDWMMRRGMSPIIQLVAMKLLVEL